MKFVIIAGAFLASSTAIKLNAEPADPDDLERLHPEERRHQPAARPREPPLAIAVALRRDRQAVGDDDEAGLLLGLLAVDEEVALPPLLRQHLRAPPP